MTGLPVRVMVEDSWDQVMLELDTSTTVADAKQRALSMTHTVRDASDYLVKFRGAEIQDEDQSLADAGIVPNAALIVMPRRRRPVR